MLENIKAPRGANKRRKRVGRGESSGHGKTCCRGGKGQTARTGNTKPRVGFEGGQMPLYRRAPKRGFHNISNELFTVVNVGDLDRLYKEGELVDLPSLKTKGLVHKVNDGIKVLGDGEIKKRLIVKLTAYSQSAKSKIEAAGGVAEVV